MCALSRVVQSLTSPLSRVQVCSDKDINQTSFRPRSEYIVYMYACIWYIYDYHFLFSAIISLSVSFVWESCVDLVKSFSLFPSFFGCFERLIFSLFFSHLLGLCSAQLLVNQCNQIQGKELMCLLTFANSL